MLFLQKVHLYIHQVLDRQNNNNRECIACSFSISVFDSNIFVSVIDSNISLAFKYIYSLLKHLDMQQSTLTSMFLFMYTKAQLNIFVCSYTCSWLLHLQFYLNALALFISKMHFKLLFWKPTCTLFQDLHSHHTHFISFQKQEKYKDAEPSAIDLFKEMHCSKKKGFSENVQKAIVSACFPFMFVLTTCNFWYTILMNNL